ncbi:MAG: NAD(P)/FAD-dependent oxidoreductase [Polyangiaceae bacterium]|nr:NAD(P)/FAD-dependent oxidoreductase [Polyangiaceae bacterium]
MSASKRQFDVVVVGSGIGGLGAALTAARAGLSVLVLEAGKQFGGYTNPFKRGKFRFDPGLHYIGECGPGQSLTRMLESLGLADEVRFRELSPDGFDRLVFPGYEIAMPRGADRYRERLTRDFPHEERGLERFFAVLAEFRASIAAVGRVRDLRSALRVARHVPFLVRHVRATFADVIDPLVRDPLLRAVLAAQGGDYGLPPSRASALIGLGLLDHYLSGAYYPLGGSRALRDAFVRGIEAHGGELRRNSPVDKIVVRGGRARAVRVRGEEIAARLVVSNADAVRTYRDLVGTEHLPFLLRRKTARTRQSVASICLFMGTDLDVAAAGMTDANIWAYPTVDLERAYAPLFEGRLPEGELFFLSSPSLKETGAGGHGATHGAPPGHHTLELVTLAPYEPFAQWDGLKSMRRGAEYEALKRELADRYLGCVERYVPGIREHLDVLEVATPVTNVTYAAAPRGAIYGPDAGPDQMGPFRFPTRSPIGGLLLCGSSTLGAGIVPSALSGFQAGKQAVAALRKGRAAHVVVPRVPESTAAPTGRAKAPATPVELEP